MRSLSLNQEESSLPVVNLTPREIVAELDKYIVGQADAKRSVAIAMRNRWRRKQLPEEMQRDVTPKNILMMGPTGVGKTEIARRLARLTGAPFIKVEATRYTEVGYYGRDVESMVRELLDNAIALVRESERKKVEADALQRANDRLLDLLCPRPVQTISGGDDDNEEENAEQRYQRTRTKMKAMLDGGKLEERTVEIKTEIKAAPMMFSGAGLEQMDVDLPGMLEKIMPKSTKTRKLSVTEARKILFEQEAEGLLDQEKINVQAIELTENLGILFIDEIDKVVDSDSGRGTGVSRQGVQRDLLPIVEGTTVQTKHGYVKTDHILFVAAGAFHKTQASDLMPELQGRFPIRVELNDLTKDDFVQILTEPENSLTRQYQALMQTEGVSINFTTDAIEALAAYAYQVNQTTQNIGARRLYTILERMLDELSFEASDMKMGKVEINAAYVQQRLKSVVEDEDLSKFIL